MRRLPAWPLWLSIALAATGLATAQSAPARRTVWDGVYTEVQAGRGITAFNQNCARCHSLTPTGRSPLAGDSFWKSFSQKTAADVLDYISANMPNGAPRSLKPETYEDIVAAILKSNGFPAGAAELGPAAMPAIHIVPQDGNTELPAEALGYVVGCLARSGTDWVVANATAPERAERVRPAEEEAVRPLGNRRIALKFVLTKLDALNGSRVAVRGLLMGAGGADGINVTGVTRVAQTCP
jgi:mono/diheme cytochrome c family protein